MISKLINKKEGKNLIRFSDCIKKTGIYKRDADFNTHENLVVINEEPYPVYFGIYDNGTVFSHVGGKGDPNREYYRIGDIELIVKVLEARND